MGTNTGSSLLEYPSGIRLPVGYSEYSFLYSLTETLVKKQLNTINGFIRVFSVVSVKIRVKKAIQRLTSLLPIPKTRFFPASAVPTFPGGNAEVGEVLTQPVGLPLPGQIKRVVFSA